MKFVRILSLITFFLMGISDALSCDKNVELLSPAQFQTRLANDSSAVLLDVRRPDEFATGHLKGAMLMNWLDTDAFKKEALCLDKSRAVYLYCRSGRRSGEAAAWLESQGFNVVDMAGGILAWEKCGLPVSTDDSTVDITYNTSAD